jgi:hypothetical protein
MMPSLFASTFAAFFSGRKVFMAAKELAKPPQDEKGIFKNAPLATEKHNTKKSVDKDGRHGHPALAITAGLRNWRFSG